MSVGEELRALVSASSAQALSAIADVPSDGEFTTTEDESEKTAADYSLLVAQDKLNLAIGLGTQEIVTLPVAFTTKAQAATSIGNVEGILEDQILRLSDEDYAKPPPTLGFPIDCNLDTYYDCVVAHSQRDIVRANAISLLFP